jgi:hypothetical protein
VGGRRDDPGADPLQPARASSRGISVIRVLAADDQVLIRAGLLEFLLGGSA